jgi:hypothetical protein
MGPVKIAFMAGLAITLAALVPVLSEAPPRVIEGNAAAAGAEVEIGVTARTDARVCQSGERLPRGATSIRPSLYALTGPPVEVRVDYRGRMVAFGEHGSGWTGTSVTLPIGEVTRTLSPVTVCFTATQPSEPMLVIGIPTAARVAAYRNPGRPYEGQIKIAYVGAGQVSWLTSALSVARRMGLGRAWSGSWIAVLVGVLMLAALGLVARLIASELDA